MREGHGQRDFAARRSARGGRADGGQIRAGRGPNNGFGAPRRLRGLGSSSFRPQGRGCAGFCAGSARGGGKQANGRRRRLSRRLGGRRPAGIRLRSRSFDNDGRGCRDRNAGEPVKGKRPESGRRSEPRRLLKSGIRRLRWGSGGRARRGRQQRLRPGILRSRFALIAERRKLGHSRAAGDAASARFGGRLGQVEPELPGNRVQGRAQGDELVEKGCRQRNRRSAASGVPDLACGRQRKCADRGGAREHLWCGERHARRRGTRSASWRGRVLKRIAAPLETTSCRIGGADRFLSPRAEARAWAIRCRLRRLGGRGRSGSRFAWASEGSSLRWMH